MTNAFWEAGFEDGAGGRALASCPILTGGPMTQQAAAILLRSQAAAWPAPEMVTVTLPRHQYQAIVSDGPPFRWTGAWNCEKSGRSFAFTVDSVASIPSREALLRFLETLRCHP